MGTVIGGHCKIHRVKYCSIIGCDYLIVWSSRSNIDVGSTNFNGLYYVYKAPVLFDFYGPKMMIINWIHILCETSSVLELYYFCLYFLCYRSIKYKHLKTKDFPLFI